MLDVKRVGADWLLEQVRNFTESIVRLSPSRYNEAHRFLPESVTPLPGYIRFAVNPFMREIVDCFDIHSPVREVSMMKGVQITYTTVLESGMFYFMGHVKTLPIMYMTADKELAKARIENNVLPMLQQSDMGHIIRSSDIGNSRKTGKTMDHLQFEGGGYMVPFGARNADKMRSYSICVLLKDEIDAWPAFVGQDGDPDALSDDRCSAYWERRKIFRGSTPLLKHSSKIEIAYLRGDQRKYMVLCKKCGTAQELRWEILDNDGQAIGGMMWDMSGDTLVMDSVRYVCPHCSEPHYEYDKERLFSADYGAHWKPTATPVEPWIRSYHLPALYSPIGMQPWSKCVGDYLRGYDVKERKVRDIKRYQVFYNNILAKPFEVIGYKVELASVVAHRRAAYMLGQVPNNYARKHAGSEILVLTCQVDVHKANLAIAVMGWSRDARTFLIDYWRYETETKDADCSELSSPVWNKLRDLIESKEYIADDGRRYKIALTLVDAGYANDTVTTFCSEYESGIFPILGRDRPSKHQTIREFTEFTTQSGTVGYRILVDHYKDRLGPVLRRDWEEVSGVQPIYHFNAPLNTPELALKELTVEKRQRRTDSIGRVSYFWHRPGNARNELWDLLVYGHAAIEILAWSVCIHTFELETVEWEQFWNYLSSQKLYYTDECDTLDETTAILEAEKP